MTTAIAALDATGHAAVTAGLRLEPPPLKLSRPPGGWFAIGHNVCHVIDRLPKAKRATARAIYWAYRKLANRNGDAPTFPAAVHLIAEMSGASPASVKRLDAFFRDAGLISIAAVKDDRGLDAPRRVTLHIEFALPQDNFEELTADEIRQALPMRRQPQVAHHELPVAQRVVSAVSDTKRKDKENPKETISPLPASRDKRESVEDCWRNLAEENGMKVDEVRRLYDQHVANMSKLTSAYPNANNFRNNFAALKARHHKSVTPQAEKIVAAVQRAEVERERRWRSFAASGNVAAPSFDVADAPTRLQFMASNEGASYRALAENWGRNGAYYTLDEETGEIMTKSQ